MDDLLTKPTVVVPNKAFLVGAIHGFNAGRLLERQRLGQSSEIQSFSTAPTYVGHWFHVECENCQYVFAYDAPNELPEEDLMCPSCLNMIIKYNSFDSAEWHIGPIKL
jgi:hypothetical protein